MIPESLVLPVYERLSGRRSWSQFQRLRTWQWRPAGELEERALQKLRGIVVHAGTQVPYYRDLFRAHDLDPRDVRSLQDLARLPLTTKATLRREFPDRAVAANVPRRRLLGGTTSGSTGTPFRFYRDRQAEDGRHASYRFFLDWTGATLRDTRVVIAYHASTPREARGVRAARRLLLGEQTLLLSGVDLTAAGLSREVDRLRGRYFIQAYPSYATRLAGAILDEGRALAAYPVTAIAMTETLTPVNAAAIGRAFRCPVANHYSSWEILHIAQSCPDNPDVLHVNSERVIAWIAGDDGRPAAAGERGRVVLTDLDNYAMPFINYDIGDWAVADRPCPCGRGLPTIRELEGRVGEVIRTPDGRVIAPGALTRRLTRQILDRVWEFQAVQGSSDAVVLRVVPSVRFSAETGRALQRDLEEFFGPAMRVSIDVVDRIPLEPSGKRLIIKPLPRADPSAD
jgi:phenylacetate-CoA ligase